MSSSSALSERPCVAIAIAKILEVACYSNLKQLQGSAVRDIQTPLGRFKLI